MTATDTLIDVVDRLTIDHIVTTELDTGKRHFETHPGLIRQLRHAIVGDIGVAGAGGSSSEPSVIDFDAVDKYAAVRSEIMTRCAEAGLSAPIDKHYPERDLMAWRASFLAYASLEEQHAEYVALSRIERVILDKFDPPRRPQLTNVTCPVCGLSWWLDNRDRNDIVRRVAITVTYRPGDLERSTAECGHCAVTRGPDEPRGYWRGLDGLRDLADRAGITPMEVAL